MFGFFKKTPPPLPEKPLCPSCKAGLEKFPASKRKCPHCGEIIIVRTHYESGNKILLTEAQAQSYETQREEHYRVKRLVDGLKVMDSALTSRLMKGAKRENPNSSAADIAWEISNRMIMLNPESARGIHFRQAMFLYESGKDYTYIRVKDYQAELREYKKSDVITGVEILSAGEQSCLACQALHEKKYSIAEALRQNPLPCKECTFDIGDAPIGWCRCAYAPIIS